LIVGEKGMEGEVLMQTSPYFWVMEFTVADNVENTVVDAVNICIYPNLVGAGQCLDGLGMRMQEPTARLVLDAISDVVMS